MKVLLAVFLLGLALATGYIVASAQHAHRDAPPPSGCTFWGLMQHNPHGKKCEPRIEK